MKLKQNSVIARKVAGKIRSQGALSIWSAPSAISTPQLVSGLQPGPQPVALVGVAGAPTGAGKDRPS
jgi:hypothetical protein